MAPPEPCLAIAGPTASGKTAIALALAERVRERLGRTVEIISVDSALVYRGMDIGTAKPDARERAIAPHHLIDILDPAQSYSAAAFAADARRLVDDIRARGAIPLLVGGTMLYFRALMQGLHDMPASSAAVRAEIDAQAAAQGWPALHAELARVDPQTAARLSPMDSQRIQRALEVWRVSGRPMSHFHAAPAPASAHGVPVTLFSLEPQNRAWLHVRIAQRFDAMLQQGFVDEVRMLRQRQGLHANLPSMRCVGYRQAWDMLDALQAQGGGGDVVPQEALDVLRARATAATRQLAKRQLTWLRSMAYREVLPCDQADIGAVAVQRLLARLHDTNSKSA